MTTSDGVPPALHAVWFVPTEKMLAINDKGFAKPVISDLRWA